MRLRQVLRFCLVAGLVYFSPAHIRLSDAQGTESRERLHGTVLSSYCSGHTDIDAGVCSGYILAIAESMLGGQVLYGQKACGHEGIRAQQLVDLVRLDLGRDASLSAQNAGPMVARILAGSFPCYDSFEPAAGSPDASYFPAD